MEPPEYATTWTELPRGRGVTGIIKPVRPQGEGWGIIHTVLSTDKIYWTWKRQSRLVPGVLKPPLGETDE